MEGASGDSGGTSGIGLRVGAAAIGVEPESISMAIASATVEQKVASAGATIGSDSMSKLIVASIPTQQSLSS